MLQPSRELNLAEEARWPHCGGDLGVQHLERNLPVVLQVMGYEDRRRSPAGQLALDSIPAGDASLQPWQQVHRGERHRWRCLGSRPDCRNQRLRLGSGLRGVVLGELVRERLIGLERAGAIAVMVQQTDQPAHERLVTRRQPHGSPGPVRGRREIALRLTLLDQGSRRPRGCLLQPGARALEPALEVGRPRDEEPLEQRTTIQVHGLEPLAGITGALEGCDVRPDLPEVQAYLLVAAADYDARAEGRAEHAERLA